ncbi:MAG: VOC family protein [Actinobacteria bacterium]|nr:VOC family protein [Actinomycetota bacterium]MDI6831215.1 VOC family protein [Actinomycetota bacterium]
MSRGDRLRMPRLSQVGIYVKDMDRTIARYQEVFGIGPWLVQTMKARRCEYQGCKAKLKSKIGVAFSGKVQLELIQVLEGPNVYLDTLGGREEGLHHLAFEVSDLEERVRACREAGIEILQEGTFKRLGMRIDYAYLDTRESVGVILEFIQTSLLGIKLRMYPAVVKLLARSQERFGLPPGRS